MAFCEYLDPATTEIAVDGLNGMELGDKHLRVRRASVGVQQASGLDMSVNVMSMLAGTTSQELQGGRVLQLLNMVTPEELMDNDDYDGKASTVRFPRLKPLFRESPTWSGTNRSEREQRFARMFEKNARSTVRSWS